MVMRSTLTSKGQTTIPGEVRKRLDLKAGDGLVYSIEDDHIIVRPVKGTILDAYATVKPKQRPEDFSMLRKQARKKRAKHIAEKK